MLKKNVNFLYGLKSLCILLNTTVSLKKNNQLSLGQEEFNNHFY